MLKSSCGFAHASRNARAITSRISSAPGKNFHRFTQSTKNALVSSVSRSRIRRMASCVASSSRLSPSSIQPCVKRASMNLGSTLGSGCVAADCLPPRWLARLNLRFIVGPYTVGQSRCKLTHDAIEPRLAFEADAGTVIQRQIAVLKYGVVGEAAEIAEHAGIGFRAAQTEAGSDRERHLVAAMRKQQTARPLVARQHLDRARILYDAVSLRRIDLNDVLTRRAQAAEAYEIFHVLSGEQILAGGERRVVGAGDLGEQREVERVARLLEPAEPKRFESSRVGQRLIAAEFGVGVDRELAATRQERFHRLDAGEIVSELHAADFHLEHRIAGIEMAAHLVLQILRGLAWRVPARAHVAKHLLGDLAIIVVLGEQAVQRLLRDLGHRIPDRDLDGADADRALAVAAGLFVLHHHRENLL